MSNSALSIVPLGEPRVEALPGAETLRPARFLTGWMRPDDSYRLLNPGINGPIPVSIIETVQRARQAVAARVGGIDQAGLISSVPAELGDHVRALKASPAAVPMYAEGWQVALVDLARVCAFQPAVLSDQALDRVQFVDQDDLTSIATVTLPLTQGDPLPIQYDYIRQAWIVVSDNQNLRIVSNVGPMPGNHCGTGLGFEVIAGPSFMQVGRYKGRHYLRDGYHRAFGLLSRGITVVPAFVRDITAFEELVKDPRTMLPQDSYSGRQPPTLPDYLDNCVSTAVQVPATRKMINIQALELTPVG